MPEPGREIQVRPDIVSKEDSTGAEPLSKLEIYRSRARLAVNEPGAFDEDKIDAEAMRMLKEDEEKIEEGSFRPMPRGWNDNSTISDDDLPVLEGQFREADATPNVGRADNGDETEAERMTRMAEEAMRLREAEKLAARIAAEEAQRAAKAGNVNDGKTRKGPEPEVEKDDYYRDQLLEDLRTAVDPDSSKDKVRVAKKRLRSNKVYLDRGLSVDDVEDVISIIAEPEMAKSKLNQVLLRKLRLLNKFGVDESRFLRVNLPNGVGDATKDSQSAMPESERRLRDMFAAAPNVAPDPRQRLQYLSRQVQNYVAKFGEPPADVLKTLADLRDQIVAGDDEIGAPGEIELTELDRNPLMAELNKPLPGGKRRVQIADPIMGMPRTVERAALSPEKHISISRLRALLVDGWRYEAAKLLGESGEAGSGVSGSIRSSSAAISNIVEGVRVSIAAAQEGKKQLVDIFPSLKVRDGDPLGTASLLNYLQERGFDVNDPRVMEIPEIECMTQLEGLLEIQEALATEASVLSRLRGASDKLESLVEVVAPFPSAELMKLWNIGRVREGVDRISGLEIGKVEDYEDTMLRLYWAIARVSDLRPDEDLSSEDRQKIPLELESFIRQYLTVTDDIETEDGIKKETYVLSRWANLPEEKKRLFDEFMYGAVRFNILEILRKPRTDDRDLEMLSGFDKTLREKLSGQVRVAENLGMTSDPIDVVLRFAKLRADTDCLTLGMAEQMGSFVVHRLVKQKTGQWDMKDLEKALKYGNLYMRSFNGSLVRTTGLIDGLQIGEYTVIERKVVGYPTSSDAVKLAQARSKLESGTIEGSAPGSTMIGYMLKHGLVPEVWIANYMQNTSVVAVGSQRSLWDYWWTDEKKLSELSGLMERGDRGAVNFDAVDPQTAGTSFDEKGVAGDVYTKWLKSRKAAYGFYDLLTKVTPEHYKGMFGANGTWRKIDDYFRDGLALPEIPFSERAQVRADMKAAYLTMVLLYVNGLSYEQSPMDLVRNVESQNAPGSEAAVEIDNYLRQMFDPQFGVLDERGRRLAKAMLLAYNADLKRWRVPEGAWLNLNKKETLADAFRSVSPLYTEPPMIEQRGQQTNQVVNITNRVFGSLKTTLKGFTGQ